MGKEGKFDLKLAGPPPAPESSEEEEEEIKGKWNASWTISSRWYKKQTGKQASEKTGT